MMPAYNFQEQFVHKIIDGSKLHTVRKKRKRPTKVGDKLSLYTGMRTKQCKLIKLTECTSITPIQVIRGVGVLLNGRLLSKEETIKFALDDGFEDAWKFFDFFDRYTFEIVSEQLELISWKK